MIPYLLYVNSISGFFAKKQTKFALRLFAIFFVPLAKSLQYLRDPPPPKYFSCCTCTGRQDDRAWPAAGTAPGFPPKGATSFRQNSSETDIKGG